MWQRTASRVTIRATPLRSTVAALDCRVEWWWLLRIVVFVTFLMGDGAGASGISPAVRSETPQETVFVASNGWHSAIFVLRKAVTRKILPEVADFPGARYIGFGWGDADYFPERDPGILAFLNAALLPTPSVIHVTGLRIHPRDAYPKDDVVALTLSQDNTEKLIRYIADTFDRRHSARANSVAPGLDLNSRFYRARGEFHLLNTCNSWTARGLVVAGVRIDADGLVRAEELMTQVRELVSP